MLSVCHVISCALRPDLRSRSAQDVEAYLIGKSSSSEYIQLSPPDLDFADLGPSAVRPTMSPDDTCLHESSLHLPSPYAKLYPII